jgi:hypothetical protein
VLHIDWRENSQSYFHTLQALDVSPTCDAANVKSIIQLFPHSSQHVTRKQPQPQWCAASKHRYQLEVALQTQHPWRSPTKKKSHGVRSGDLGGHLSKGRSRRILSITCPKMSLHTWHWRCLGEFQYAESFLLCTCRHFEHNSPWQTELLRAHQAGDSDQNFERSPFHPDTGHGFSVSSFCKRNFWKCILLFEYTYIFVFDYRLHMN